ncbi:MAG: outer membrane protein assembly factor BamE [Pseudomonadota bacterium]
MTPTKTGLLFALTLLATQGCGGNLQVHGHIPDPDVVSQISPGSDTRQSVVDLLGTPSTISTFEDQTWYYIGQKTEQFAFMKPDVIERQILVVSFSDTGFVEETRNYALEHGRVIDPVTRETPTEGKELTFLQQMFGNFGRFDQDSIGQ